MFCIIRKFWLVHTSFSWQGMDVSNRSSKKTDKQLDELDKRLNKLFKSKECKQAFKVLKNKMENNYKSKQKEGNKT